MNDIEIETEIQAKGLTAPRVTPADIEANINNEFYFTAEDGVVGRHRGEVVHSNELHAMSTLTFCVLVLRSGFTVTGESACASPENFDAELGRKIARQNAINKVWPLMGFELKCRLAREAAPTDFRDRVRAEHLEVDDRSQKLEAFLGTEAYSKLPEAEQKRLCSQYQIMRDYAEVLRQRIAAFQAVE